MEKYIIVDLSGKVELYDDSLRDALNIVLGDVCVRLLRPGKGLFSLVPRKFKNSESLLKRFVKVTEGLINYCYLLFIIFFKNVKVLHIQWLPFLEVNGWEISILKIFKIVSPKTKLVLTIHNVYPHNMGDKVKRAYNARFRKASELIDEFIVHTEISKLDVVQEFGLDADHVNVCCHGVFVPKDFVPKSTNRENGKLRILQFGGQSFYKGTDILVDAVCGLDKSLQNKIEIHIVGKINESFLSELKNKDPEGVINWQPSFLEDQNLYQEISNSDLIILPYRAISQSGVLLLSIYFEKLIICSDLPSFKETMQGGEGLALDDMLFFKSENSESLRRLLTKYINKEVDENLIRGRISRLKAIYSWNSAAKATLQVYNK